MAGRKHHLQEHGYVSKDLSGITDPIERDMAFKSISLTPYCKHCGREILMMAKEQDGVRKYTVEAKMRAHTDCQNLWEEKERTRIAIEAREKAKAFTELDMDKYLEQLAKQRDE